MPYKPIDISGMRSGSLVAIKKTRKDKHNNWYWQCQCDCGNISEVVATAIKNQKILSCGCRKEENHNKNHFRWKGCGEISGSLWCLLKIMAKNRKLELTVTKEYIWELFLKQGRKCAISGVDIHFKTRTNKCDATASLDRINSKLGYVPGNVQWIHKDINFMKQDYNQDEFINWCNIITNYQQGK